MNKLVTGTAAAAIAVAALAGCHSGSGTGSAKAKAAASSTAVQTTKKNLEAITAKCGTGSAAGQIAAVKDLRTKAGRARLWAKCGVPAAKRSAVQTQALDAAEHAHLTTHAGRVTYFEVTLPAIIERNQA